MMSATRFDYDLLVIGSGPAGQKAALEAARLGRRVALVERRELGGGVTTGLIPSKVARAAILEHAGAARRAAHAVTIDDLLWRVQHVVAHERAVVHEQLRRNGVELLEGAARFATPHTLTITGTETLRRSAEKIVIAVGTTRSRPPEVDFDGTTVIGADGLVGLRRVPATMTVVGGGVTGLEYASIAAVLGVTVTLVEQRTQLLEFVDDELVDALYARLRALGLTLRLGDAATAVERQSDGTVVTRLASGKRIPSEVVLHTGGRRGATAGLRLEAAGLAADEDGRIAVDGGYRTAQPHIFAVGDVIGFPALAATSMEQGRVAARAAFGLECRSAPELTPHAIYTIPEISFVGRSEEALAASRVPYVAGVARYRDLVRGEIAGDTTGLLKLLVHADSRELEGVHVFGTGAAELVHIGQTVMAARLGLDYLVDAVFNYPSFADAYRVAAVDATAKLTALAAAA